MSPIQALSQMVTWYIQEGVSTLEVDVKKVQEELVKQGARIHWEFCGQIQIQSLDKYKYSYYTITNAALTE